MILFGLPSHFSSQTESVKRKREEDWWHDSKAECQGRVKQNPVCLTKTVNLYMFFLLPFYQ
jgi:hypothetical protein